MYEVEVIGVLASVIVLISFIFDSEKKIRIINILGCTLFVIYGVLIHSFSVWFLNGMLLFVHLNKLLKMRGKDV